METLEEGVCRRIAHYKDISGELRAGLKALGLKLFLPEELYSNTMTSVILPAGLSYEDLYSKCKEKGYTIYNSQGKLEGKVFRLGVVGVITKKDIQDFLQTLREIV
jgi:aspartate aminotransferase-like enzyme